MSSEAVEVLKLIFSGIAVLVSLASFYYAWHSAKNRAQKEEIEGLRSRIAEVEERRARSNGELRDRMGRLEAEFPHLPSTATVHELAIRIEEMHGDLKGVTEALKGVKGQLETVNTHLLRESMKQ